MFIWCYLLRKIQQKNVYTFLIKISKEQQRILKMSLYNFIYKPPAYFWPFEVYIFWHMSMTRYQVLLFCLNFRSAKISMYDTGLEHEFQDVRKNLIGNTLQDKFIWIHDKPSLSFSFLYFQDCQNCQPKSKSHDLKWLKQTWYIKQWYTTPRH
jgi:hypothetical protein